MRAQGSPDGSFDAFGRPMVRLQAKAAIQKEAILEMLTSLTLLKLKTCETLETVGKVEEVVEVTEAVAINAREQETVTEDNASIIKTTITTTIIQEDIVLEYVEKDIIVG
ncbi:hypothetical protein FBU30_001555 [Linnemannia zychae]|nr:hypothetical protein FBU30_001555 [Linnemannia zychae]